MSSHHNKNSGTVRKLRERNLVKLDSFVERIEHTKQLGRFVALMQKLPDILKFTSRDTIHSTLELCIKKAEIILDKDLSEDDVKTLLPSIAANIASVSRLTNDYRSNNEAVFKQIAAHVMPFIDSLNLPQVMRLMNGFSVDEGRSSQKIYDALSARYLEIAKQEKAISLNITTPLRSFAQVGYQPSRTFYEQWDKMAEDLKESTAETYQNTMNTKDYALALYHFSLMKAQGLEVDSGLVEKWFDYAAHTKDGTFDHRSWQQMYLTALAFDIENPERFRMGAIIQTKSNSYAQKNFSRALKKEAKFTEKHHDISILVEDEALSEVIDSKVDFKITIAGGVGAKNESTTFWVQFDGANHYVQSALGRDYNVRTKLQNMLIEPRLQPDERFERIDMAEVQDKIVKYQDKEMGNSYHASDFIKRLVEEHKKRVLGVDKNAKETGWQQNL